MLRGLLDNKVSIGDAGGSLEGVLEEKLRSNDPSYVCSGNVKLDFARRTAKCLMQEDLSKIAEDGQSTISVSDLALCKTGLEVVVVWWLWPVLDAGIARVVSKRHEQGVGSSEQQSGSAYLAQKQRAEKEAQRKEWERCAPDQSPKALWNAASVLFNLSRRNFVSSLVREAHLLDLIGALLQLSYGPAREHEQEAKKALFALLSSLPVDTVLEHLLPFVSPQGIMSEWTSVAVGSLLSQTMLRPGGVLTLLSMLLTTSDKPHLRTEEGIEHRAAVLVTVVPRKYAKDPTQFYKLLCPQIVPCMHSPLDGVKRAASLCVERLLRQDPETTIENLLKPVLGPLWSQSVLESGSEEDVDMAFMTLAGLSMACASSAVFWETVGRFCGRRVFLIACRTFFGVSRVKRVAVGALESMFKSCMPASMLRGIVFRQILAEDVDVDNIVVSFGPSGGVQIEANAAGAPRDFSKECQVLCQLVKNQSKGLSGDLFAHAMLCLAQKQEDVEVEANHLKMLQLASELLEDPSSLLEDASQVLLVVKTLLDTPLLPDSVAELCVGIVDALLQAGLELEKHQEILLTDLLPFLELELPSRFVALADACKALRDTIAAPNATWRKAKVENPKASEAEGGETDNSVFDQVMADLKDPLLPVRAHAIIQLRKLVLEKDAATMARFQAVLDIFSAQLRDADSYVYLGGIYGLAALGDVATDATLQVLIKEFHNRLLPVHVRVKLGEALVQIMQRCGEVLPVYAPQCMDCFFRAILQKDGDADVRASAFANVGHMCEVLRWALHPYIGELMYCVDCALGGLEKDVFVRRAAIAVFNLLLNGMGSDLFVLMSRGGYLQRMQEILDLAEKSDPDDIVKRHARDAQEYMQELVLL